MQLLGPNTNCTYHVNEGISDALVAVPGPESLVQLFEEALVNAQYRRHHVENLVHQVRVHDVPQVVGALQGVQVFLRGRTRIIEWVSATRRRP